MGDVEQEAPVPAQEENAGGDAPAEPATEPPAAANLSRRGSKGSGQVSRKGSQQVEKTMEEIEPQSPADPPPAEEDGEALARKASKASLPASRKGSAIMQSSQISRHASRQGSAVAGLSAQGSRKGSALLGASRTSSQRGSAAAAAAVAEEPEEEVTVDWRFNYQSVRKDLEAAKQKLADKERVYEEQQAEIEDLNSQLESAKSSKKGGGGDRVSNDEVEKFRKQAKAKEEEQDDEIRELEIRVRRRDSQVKGMAEDLKDLEKSVSRVTDLALQKEMSKKEARALTRSNTQLNNTIDELRDQVRELEQDLRDKRATKAAKSRAPVPAEVAQQLQELQVAAQARNMSAQERAGNIQRLKEKLDHAQAAIVSATDQVWENDIKLAQARRALVMILENDPKAKSPSHGSPAR